MDAHRHIYIFDAREEHYDFADYNGVKYKNHASRYLLFITRALLLYDATPGAHTRPLPHRPINARPACAAPPSPRHEQARLIVDHESLCILA